MPGATGRIVGVFCPIEEIMRRRNADPRGSLYAAGPGVPEPVQRFLDNFHRGQYPDLEMPAGPG